MSETKFTPGPWRSELLMSSIGGGYSRWQHSIIDTATSTDVAVVVGDRPVNRADAHLIAAAPDLYDIVYDLWAYAADAPDIHLRALAERARDTLAKAEGHVSNRLAVAGGR
jgi:hypothetical protein